MDKLFLLRSAVLVFLSFSVSSVAAVTADCDELTGRKRSKCLFEQRRGGHEGSAVRERRDDSRETRRDAQGKPDKPIGLSPGTPLSPGSSVADQRVVLRWSASEGASEYDFGIRDTISNALVVDARTRGTSYSDRLESGRAYRWNVRACNESGCSAFSSPLYFTLGNPATRSEAGWSKTTVPSAAGFPLFSQLNSGDLRLYSSADWAEAMDAVSKKPRKELTCLATVYAMLEHSRGKFDYRVGPHNYSDAAGAARPRYVSGDIELRSFEPVREQLTGGRPVILWGPVSGNPFGHFILAVGINEGGSIVAHDPWSGKRVTVDPGSARVNGGSPLRSVARYRTISF